MIKLKNKFLLIAIIATFISGCRSTDDYKNFAEAGNSFVKANNSLLDAAKNITVNTTSERILSDRMNLNYKPSDEVNKNFVARYSNYSKSDKERLEFIKELRAHNLFLQSYFDKLLNLANSDSPGRTQKAVDNIVGQLQDSGAKLQIFAEIGKLPSVTKIVLDARIRGAIRNELENRKDTIYREITIQEKSLEYLSNSMKHDIEVTRNLQEYRLVLKPLLQAPEDINADEWIQTRNKVMTQDAEIMSTINQASASLGKFKDIFIASVEGEVSSKRLNKFIQETNSFSELVRNQVSLK